MDYALAHGVTALTGVARTSWLSQILTMGWRCEVLGPPVLVNGTMTGAFRIHIDEATAAGLANRGIYTAGTIAAADGIPSLELGPIGQEARPFFPEPEAISRAAEGWARHLLADGYCIIPSAIPDEWFHKLNEDLDDRFERTPFCQGAFYGARTKRFGSLLKRSPAAADFVGHPLILAIAQKVLGPWCDRFNLNLTQAIEIHPGAPAQFPHRDQEMWQGEKGRIEYLVNVLWPLSEFTTENGATRIWPGSHHPGASDQSPREPPVAAEMSPGSVLLFLGFTLHAAGGNYASSVRRGLIVSYCLGWLKPFENQWLCYPPEVARGFYPELAKLVGYSQHRPNLGNYEGQCPSILLRGDPHDYIAASDALRPDQQVDLAKFLAEQPGGEPEDGTVPR